MPKAELSTHIDRLPEDVFGYVTEFTNNPKWRRNVIDTWWIDEGPTRPGRRGGQAARILGRRMDVTAEIVGWDPPRAASWKTVQGSATLVATAASSPSREAAASRMAVKARSPGSSACSSIRSSSPPCSVAPDPISPDLRLPWRTAQPAR